MSLELIAVAGMGVAFSPPIIDPPPEPPPTEAPTVSATAVVLPPTGTKVSASALVHRNGDKVVVTNITVDEVGATIPDTGPYEVGFVSGSTKVKAEGEFVLLEGDQSEVINATPQIPSPPPDDPVDFPISFTVIVDSAGQTKAFAE